MKTLPLIPLVILLSCRWAAAEVGQTVVPHITVSGTAVTEVRPDRLQWSIEVKTTDSDLAKAADIHSKEVASVLEALKAQGIAEKDIQTAHMRFAENAVYRQNEYVKDGYKATTKILARMDDLDKYQPLWRALASLKGVSVEGVAFDHSKRIELNKETRVNALKAAKEKAAAMAEVLGAKVGEPLEVEEDLIQPQASGYNVISNSTNRSQRSGFVEAPTDESSVLAPGSLPIMIRVRVTFRLLNPGN